jgi:cytoskeletal protein RodZ
MALFNRNKDTKALPEVEQYYQAERRDRTGLAWLLALVSMIIVAGLLVGIFMAGRWAYDQLANNDDEVAITETSEEAPSFDGAPTDNSAESTPAETPSAGTDEEVKPNPAVTAPTTTPAPTQTPRTGSDELPRTGAGSIAMIFTGVTLAAGSAHYAVQRRSLRRS